MKSRLKMHLTMKSTLILLLISITFSITAQHSYIPSERTYTTKDGLSSDKILSLHKDSQGFIWIGTQNGLNRFDGYTFVEYSTKTPPQMTINRVQQIFEDKAGYLWFIKTNELVEHEYDSPEIHFFNIHTGEWLTVAERFKSIPFDINQIKYATQLEDGRLFFCIMEQRKSYFFDIENGFVSVDIPKGITQIAEVRLEDNHLWLEAYNPNYEANSYWLFYKINENGQVIAKRTTSFQINTQDQTRPIIFEGTSYVGARNIDAFHFFNSTIQPTPHQKSSISKRINQSVWNKDQELLWVKNVATLYALNSQGQVIYQKEETSSFDKIPFIFDGTTTWIGSPQNGLIRLQLQPNHFQTHQFFDIELNNSARGIYTHKDGRLWVATIHGIAQKKQTGQVETSQHRRTEFSSFLKDKSNHLWLMYKGKITKEDLSTDQQTHYDYEKWGDKWCFYEADNGDIWSFDGNGKIYILNPTTGKITTKPTFQKEKKKIIHVYSAEKVKENTIWLATSRGLYVIDGDGKLVAIYNSEQEGEYYLPTNSIHHIYRDKKDVIWLATGDAGLIRWEQTENNPNHKIEQLTTDNGLPCNTLHAIYEDENDYLWISSNDGLIQFDKQTSKVVTYTVEHGLPHNEFNRISHFQAENGTLYFGGLSGVISFHPEHFKAARHQENTANLTITKFQQFSGKQAQFIDLTHQLREELTITLQPNDRFFSLQLALLDFEEGASYQYRIKDIHDWQQTDERTISISGLPYGNHVLEVKAFNKNQQEVANTLTYSIQVLRPFYLKWWFMLLVLGALGSGVFYFIKWRTEQMLVLQETTHLRKLDKMKSQFFANISHELRTPITLILAPLTQVLKKNYLKKEDQQQLSTVYENGKNLLQIVNEILDLSKLEANKLQLNLSPTKIPQFIERLAANFESAADVKGIEIQFMAFLQKDFTASFDQQKLEQILNNLLSNALKFTSKGGIIQIMVGAMNDQLTIKVKDTGRGIPKEDISQVFNRYFQSKNKNMEGGTGIGLALTKELVELMNGKILVQSELNEGTEFEVRLPITVETLHCNVSSFNDLKEKELNTISNHHKNKNISVAQQVISKEKDTILLVEDNPSLQQFIQSILTPYYNVIVTNNGVEALEQLSKTALTRLDRVNSGTLPTASEATAHCQLILSDVMMPEMNGFTLLEKVKSDEKFCGIPFILLTARADTNDKLRGLRIGVDDYMTKPFEVEELLLRIKNLIDNAKNRSVITPQKTLSENKILVEKSTINQEPITNEDTNSQSPVTNYDLEWLEKVEQITKREIRNSKYKVNDLANELFISQRQLQRRLKAITGLTPNQYFRTIRLHQAKYILENEEPTTLTLVAYAVGFGNLTHFNRLYEAEFGKKPHTYIKK